MKTLGIALLCCSAASGQIIHATATGPVVEHYHNQGGNACLQVGDQFSIELVTQLDLDGDAVDPLFTGLRNGNHDGLPDWSDQFGMFNWPPRRGIWEAGGRYQRRVGGEGVVNFGLNPEAIDWEWVVEGNALCSVNINPISWTSEVMFNAGDADKSGIFNSADLVKVFIASEYDDGIARNSTWATGDWTGDREFDSADLVMAMATGAYNVPGAVPGPLADSGIINQPIRFDATRAIPEPSTAILLGLGALGLLFCRRF